MVVRILSSSRQFPPFGLPFLDKRGPQPAKPPPQWSGLFVPIITVFLDSGALNLPK
jgi:hypothetical protein